MSVEGAGDISLVTLLEAHVAITREQVARGENGLGQPLAPERRARRTVAGDGTFEFETGGLAAGERYVSLAVLVRPDGSVSEIARSEAYTAEAPAGGAAGGVPDPTLSGFGVVAAEVWSDRVRLRGTPNTEGTLAAVLTNASTVPSVEQVLAGRKHTGGPANGAASRAVAAGEVGGEVVLDVPVAATSAFYIGYAVFSNAAGNSAVVSSGKFDAGTQPSGSGGGTGGGTGDTGTGGTGTGGTGTGGTGTGGSGGPEFVARFTNAEAWASVGATVIDGVYHATAAGVNAPGPAFDTPSEENRDYTFSVDVLEVTTPGRLRFEIRWINASGAIIGSDRVPLSTVTPTGPTTYTATRPSPPGTVARRVSIQIIDPMDVKLARLDCA